MRNVNHNRVENKSKAPVAYFLQTLQEDSHCYLQSQRFSIFIFIRN